MNLNRLSAVALTVSGALALSACGDDSGGTTTPPDMGTPVGMDAEATDDGVTVDMGDPDAGTGMDADTGTMTMPDTGTSNLPGEAEPCLATTPSCGDGLSCVNFGGTNQICLTVCNQETDCMNSALIPPATSCANLGRLTANDGTMFGWCVQELVGEGEVVTDPPDANATGVKLQACDMNTAGISVSDTQLKCVIECTNDLECAGSVTGATVCGANGICSEVLRGEGSLATVSATVTEGCAAGLRGFGPDANQPGKIECAKTCVTAADCTAPGLNTCNVNRGFFAAEITGVCSRGEGAAGAACNDRHVVSRCTLDTESQGLVLCADFFGSINNDEEFDSVCTQYCGDLDANAMTPASACVTPFTRPGDPTPTCVTQTTATPPAAIFNNPDVGICSDGCSNSPNSCGGAIDTQCFVLQDLFNVPIDYKYCVEPAQPTLPLWNPASMAAPTPEEECGDRWHRCPADAYCLGVGGGSTACIIGCEAGAAVTGCEGKTVAGSTNLLCQPFQGETGPGFCEPM